MTRRPGVSIVDLGLGNLKSVERALHDAGADPVVVSEPEDVAAAARLVVPGQGAYRDFARALDRGHRDALTEALGRGTPYLGICLGMHGLFEESDEAPGAKGLGHFRGRVAALSTDRRDSETGARLKIPHMGWNVVQGDQAPFAEGGWFYFVHSYVCEPEDPSLTVGRAEYGGPICAAVRSGNVLACQFHPEKSQGRGHALLRYFLQHFEAA
ncbi:MAG: imidazole glycerol phosphate synthase subunit HisH [Deltaproteobacteria bacterium]|nr:imidazole glycerol phosphate synthase subunit HisH [Deltaproteobacteria bacterium]